tara:strand:- start:6094 stop:7302 length:1209 start_codon:yes stop_codon:yes gene_type:complete
VQVCISKNLLGTDKNLLCERSTGLFSWVSSPPEDAWIYGNAPNAVRSLNDLCLMFNIDPRDRPPEKYVTAYTTCGLPAGLSIPWHHALPRAVFQSYISNLVADLWSALDKINDTTYVDNFLVNREALTSLQPALIDKKILNDLKAQETNPTLISTLNSFSPKPDDKLPPPVYQQGATGRTVVKRGPKILTLKKEHRKIFKSRYPGGRIIQVDYSSLEPRIAGCLAGVEFDKDIYDSLALKTGLKLDRVKLKIAVMGALYGISPVKLQLIVGRDVDASIVLDKIRTFFKIDVLARRLLRECHESGSSIQNYYGRPLTFTKCDSHLLVSHYIQSTGVDVCLSGFRKIIEEIRAKDLGITPIYIIHDALLLDVAPFAVDDLKNLVKTASVISGFKESFPLSISKV